MLTAPARDTGTDFESALLEDLIDGLRAKPRALLHCRYQRHLFPDQRCWDFWQHLLVGGRPR